MLKEKNKQIYIHDYIITESYYTSNQQKLMRHADLLPFFRFHPHWPIVYSHPRRTKNTTTSSIICNLVFSNPPAKLTPENERTNMEPQQNSPLKEEGEIPSQNTIFGGFKICLFFWGCNFCSSIFSNVKSPPCCSHLQLLVVAHSHGWRCWHRQVPSLDPQTNPQREGNESSPRTGKQLRCIDRQMFMVLLHTMIFSDTKHVDFNYMMR